MQKKRKQERQLRADSLLHTRACRLYCNQSIFNKIRIEMQDRWYKVKIKVCLHQSKCVWKFVQLPAISFKRNEENCLLQLTSSRTFFGWCYKTLQVLCQCFYTHRLQPDVLDRCHHKLAFRARCIFHPGWKKEIHANKSWVVLKAPSNAITWSDKAGQDPRKNETCWRRCTLYFLKSSLCSTSGQTDKELKGLPQ